jgi:hypothetical protein
MRILGFSGPNELGGLCLADGELFGRDRARKQLVDEPQSIGVDDVNLAVLRKAYSSQTPR